MAKIYISSLPFKADEKYIRDLFAPFADVLGVEMHADWINPTFEPYALVEVETENVDKIVESLDGRKIGRTYIRVHRKTT